MNDQTRNERPAGRAEPTTRLKAYCDDHRIKAIALARESGVTRQHVLRVMRGAPNVRRKVMAALVSALRRMTLDPVLADDVFEFSVAEEVAFSARRSQAIEARRSNKARVEAFIASLATTTPSERRAAVLKVRGTPESESILIALLLEARGVLASKTRQSAQYAEYAAELSELLPASRRTRYLSGCAYLASGNALRRLGEYPRAIAVLDRAEAAFLDDPESASELAQTWYSRGIAAMKQWRYSEATTDTRAARAIFQLLRDSRREAFTRLLEGGIAFEQDDAFRARDIFRSTLAPLRRAEDQAALALAWMNIGSCEARLGNIEEAASWIRKAEEAFKHRRMPSELARAHWSYGYAVAKRNADEAIDLLRSAAREFDALKLPVDAAFVRLDLIEVLLGIEELDEAMSTCRGIIAVLKEAGAAEAAARAVVYLCDAIHRKEAGPVLARYVRSYVTNVQRGLIVPFEPGVAA